MLEKFSNYLYMIPLFVIGVLFLLILLKKRKEMRERLIPLTDEERESLANPIAITVLLFFTIIYVTFFGFKIIVPYPLDILTLAWYILFLAFFFVLCVREKRRYTGPPFEVKDEADLSIKYELIRKTTHAVIFLVVVCYMVIGPLFMFVVNLLLEAIGQPSLVSDVAYWGQYTVAFFTIIAFLGLSTSEIVRVYFYQAYPLKSVKKIFRQKEIGAALGSHIALTVGCLSVILIFGPTEPQIVMASISISAIADGAASVVGKRFGSHQYRTVFSKKRKTLEGMLTETIVSLVLSFLFLIYRFGAYSFLLAFVAAMVIDFIDYLSLQVSDNLINPIASALVLFLVAQLLRSLGLV
jgi:dolichol kinase